MLSFDAAAAACEVEVIKDYTAFTGPGGKVHHQFCVKRWGHAFNIEDPACHMSPKDMPKQLTRSFLAEHNYVVCSTCCAVIWV